MSTINSGAASMKAGGVQKLESLEGCECAVASSGAVLRGQTWRPGPAAGFKAGYKMSAEKGKGIVAYISNDERLVRLCVCVCVCVRVSVCVCLYGR